ncbi:hypothetical protein [Nocardia jinanensis]|uniref:Uncharacterized protein n=1 Tax=Nocardia jinanensis TaxID=382504 RepID=A0A917VZW5_9NOCA|nr:hypothetical protein [Nocardia jinanensis]GGL45062.1 hypothetical protein GCM10011588_69640 [Nocardia jinanensis]
MVLDEVWRGLEGVEALSGSAGGPLRRTVKLILDPLVIRPVQYPSCGGAVLTADGATLLAARIYAHADALRATAAWFTLLKQVRRRLRITEGTAQDLYFQRCFELATTRGYPDPNRDRVRAEALLREIHGFAAGRTTQALKDHLTDPARAALLDGLLTTAWGRRPAPPAAPGEHTEVLRRLLEYAVATRAGADTRPGRRLLGELVAATVGTHTGIELWRRGSRIAVTDLARYHAHGLGLTIHPAPCRPEVGVSASTATLGLPFDRTVHERVFTVLQVSTERAELPPIPDLVTTEIARSCAPWALLGESLRLTAAIGVELALGLAPITPRDPRHASEETADSAAHQLVNSRWQREAYVLQARRLAIHPVPGEQSRLAVIAAELRTPWRPYLRRLWVRLHGRDVREMPVTEPDELWDLLDGVARSVVLDHRTRVRKALSAHTVREPDSARAV